MPGCDGVATGSRSLHARLPELRVYALLVALLAQQVRKILMVNQPVMEGQKVPEDESYSFSQVAILCLCYGVHFWRRTGGRTDAAGLL